MRSIALVILIALAGCQAVKHKTLSKAMTLETDRNGGANGAAVAYDPDHERYYAAMAGNTYFPMFVYDKDGKILSDNLQETMFDVRGLWYNPNTKSLQSSGYDDFGLAEYKTDDKGMPEKVKKLHLVSRQPNAQSPGAYDAANNVIYFYDHDSSMIIREDSTGAATTQPLHLGAGKKSQAKKLNNNGQRKIL